MPTPAQLKLIAYVAGAIFLAAVLWAAWGYFIHWVRAPVVAELRKAEGSLEDCGRQKDGLKAALGRQSAAVADLEAKAREADERAAKAQQEARRAASGAYRQAQEILATKPLDADPCVSAAKRARAFIEERRR